MLEELRRWLRRRRLLGKQRLRSTSDLHRALLRLAAAAAAAATVLSLRRVSCLRAVAVQVTLVIDAHDAHGFALLLLAVDGEQLVAGLHQRAVTGRLLASHRALQASNNISQA